MLQSAALMPLFNASCYPNLFSNVSQSFPVSVYLKKFCQYSLQTAFLNSKKFLFKVLSPLINARYIISVLALHKELIFYNSIICFCLETQGMYQKLNIIRY